MATPPKRNLSPRRLETDICRVIDRYWLTVDSVRPWLSWKESFYRKVPCAGHAEMFEVRCLTGLCEAVYLTRWSTNQQSRAAPLAPVHNNGCPQTCSRKTADCWQVATASQRDGDCSSPSSYVPLDGIYSWNTSVEMKLNLNFLDIYFFITKGTICVKKFKKGDHNSSPHMCTFSRLWGRSSWINLERDCCASATSEIEKWSKFFLPRLRLGSYLAGMLTTNVISDFFLNICRYRCLGFQKEWADLYYNRRPYIEHVRQMSVEDESALIPADWWHRAMLVVAVGLFMSIVGKVHAPPSHGSCQKSAAKYKASYIAAEEKLHPIPS